MRYAKYTLLFEIRFLMQPLICEDARIILCIHYELPMKKCRCRWHENVTKVEASMNIEEVYRLPQYSPFECKIFID